MYQQDIRWKQRFYNFNKSMVNLEKALQIQQPDMVQKAGIIQLFEMSFELAWKMLKDYLEEQGYVDVKSPRDTIKKSFEIGLIQHGHEWMEMLTNRNLTTHTYNEEIATELETLIHQKYFPILKHLLNDFNKKYNEQ